MSKYCLVTGASSGIGRAISVRLSKCGVNVLAVARREEWLVETQRLGAPNKIDILSADVTTDVGRNAIAQAVASSGRKLDWLVQNAGIIEIAQAANIDHEKWRHSFEVNVHGPLFLVQALVPHFATDARILHISSGAAHRSYDGWSAYCVTKAAFHMMFMCLRDELASKKIHVGSVRPGIIESPMQLTCRSAQLSATSLGGKFQELKDNEYKYAEGDSADKPHRPPLNGLDTAENCAHFINFLLSETSDEDFVREEWDSRDEKNFARWIK